MAEAVPKVELIPIDRLSISLLNVRKSIGDLTDLKSSIKSQGLLQPIIVRPKNKGYEVVVGQRRFLACKELGWKEIPAIVRDLSDREALIFSLTENIQQDTLDPIERAEGVQALINDLKKDFSPIEAVEKAAKLLGKNPSTIYDWLRILGTTEAVKAMVRRKELPVRVAAKIATVPKEKQEELAKYIVEEKVTSSQAAKIIKSVRVKPSEPIRKVVAEVLEETEEYTVTVSFPGTIYTALVDFAKTKKITVQEVIRRAVKQYLRI